MTNTYNIICNNKSQFNVLMLRLKRNGYKWNSNQLPTEYDPYFRECRASNLPIVIRLRSDKTITYATNMDYYNEFADVITLEEYIKETKMRTEFKKSDLKNGMLVKTRNGNSYIFIEYPDMHIFVRRDGYNRIGEYKEDLTINRGHNDDELDIIEVYEPVQYITTLNIEQEIVKATLIWKREEVVEMTVSEIEKKLGIKNLKVVAEKGE